MLMCLFICGMKCVIFFKCVKYCVILGDGIFFLLLGILLYLIKLGSCKV